MSWPLVEMLTESTTMPTMQNEEMAAPGPIEWKCCDKEVMVMQIIRTTNLRRGDGTERSPIRAVTQYWSMQGDLLAEVDPLAPLIRE